MLKSWEGYGKTWMHFIYKTNNLFRSIRLSYGNSCVTKDLIFFELDDTENEKHYKWTLKRLKVGMVSSFHPHSMCKKVERLTAKTGCTSCTKRTISFKVSGFHTETRLLQRDFIFLNLFELHTFYVFKMHHSKPHHQFSTLSDFIWYFSCIYWFFQL